MILTLRMLTKFWDGSDTSRSRDVDQTPVTLTDYETIHGDLIWRKGTPFEAMTGRTARLSDGLLAEVFWGFHRL